ncbi:hypothetical protein RE6C_06090 [Rhodopirellula europaea 6C]|uniref:Uncharacterized protein n=1 Tax=Rhodopirellula europaea 6C TaxID=1263867 RepID=M2A347_9BACT|nr:hypothetical protein RE6C_06090 [Rhodopirellula europaea 6C]
MTLPLGTLIPRFQRQICSSVVPTETRTKHAGSQNNFTEPPPITLSA